VNAMREECFVPGTMLLLGVVGSVAYGLNRPDSDRDRLGVYAAETGALLGFDPVPETVTLSVLARTS
jgi:predicted nucleotidyltransferase